MRLSEAAAYLNDYLDTAGVPDYSAAWNGLQVEGTREVRKVALAVDAVQVTIDRAIAGGADLLVVHHGLFWDGDQPITGRRYRRIKPLLDSGVALYSAHLPLDVHPEVGNNVVLARELGVALEGHFGEYKGMPVGVWGTLEIRREALAARLDEVLGCRVRLIAGGPERVARVGIISGGAGSQISAARKAGVDAFITGEGSHHNYFDASEGGINLYFGGHYATEVWGVKALGRHIQEQLGLETFFIDHPTGL